MNDYSKYIKSAYGFIRSYKVKNGKIQIITPRNKKSQPFEYDVTPENVSEFDERLGAQQQLLITHKEEIKKDISKNARKGIYSLSLIFFIVASITLMMGNIIDINNAVFYILGALSPLTIAVGETSLAIWKQHFDKESKVKAKYMVIKAEIEEKSKEDENITKHLSPNAKKIITQHQELIKQEQMTTVFNNGFMDRANVSDLTTLIERYLISVNLHTPQVYVSQEAKTKKKTLKPHYPKHK